MESLIQKFRTGYTLDQFLKVPGQEIIREFKTLSSIFNNEFYEEKLYRCNPLEAKMNRYSDVLPYEHNRVITRKSPNKHCYLNASEVYLTSGGKCQMIACQAPVKPYNSFWQTIVDRNVGLVIMLCAFEDPRRGVI